MQNFKGVGFKCGAVVLLLAVCAQAENEIRAVSVNGSVWVGKQPLRAAQAVQPKEEVITGKDSGVKLLFPDRSIVDIGPNTRYTVETLTPQETVSQLKWGTLRASIQKKIEGKTKFRVRTKSSVLSVRGTEFVVSSTPSPTQPGRFVDQVTVSSGVVDLQMPGMHNTQNLQLDAGKQVSAVAHVDAAGSVKVAPETVKAVTVPVETVQKTMSVATVKDDTFRQVVVLAPPKQETGPPPDVSGAPNASQKNTVTAQKGTGQTGTGQTGRAPDSVNMGRAEHTPPPPTAGQDAISGMLAKAASDPSVPMMPPPTTQGPSNPLTRPPDPSQAGNINAITGSGIETKLNEGVNLTVLFQL